RSACFVAFRAAQLDPSNGHNDKRTGASRAKCPCAPSWDDEAMPARDPKRTFRRAAFDPKPTLGAARSKRPWQRLLSGNCGHWLAAPRRTLSAFERLPTLSRHRKSLLLQKPAAGLALLALGGRHLTAERGASETKPTSEILARPDVRVPRKAANRGSAFRSADSRSSACWRSSV